MSRFSGRHGKGAMSVYRATQRSEAQARNATAQVAKYTCGHIHGKAQKGRCA